MRRPIGGVGKGINESWAEVPRAVARSSPPSHRRKGVSSRRKKASIILNDHALLVFVAICLAVFLMGMLIGSHRLSSHIAPPASSFPGHLSAQDLKDIIRLSAEASKIKEEEEKAAAAAAAAAAATESKNGLPSKKDDPMLRGAGPVAVAAADAAAAAAPPAPPAPPLHAHKPEDQYYNEHHLIDDFDERHSNNAKPPAMPIKHTNPQQSHNMEDTKTETQISHKPALTAPLETKTGVLLLDTPVNTTINSTTLHQNLATNILSPDPPLTHTSIVTTHSPSQKNTPFSQTSPPDKPLQPMLPNIPLTKKRQRTLNIALPTTEQPNNPRIPPLDSAGTGAYETRFPDEAYAIRNGQPKPTQEFPYLAHPLPQGIIFDTYQPKGGSRFTEYTDGTSPYIITPSILEKSHHLARTRREYVKNAMLHLWTGYKDHAFGHDEVKPCTGGFNDRWGGLGITLVDSLDTLWLMDLKDQFWEARDWVRDKLQHTTSSKPVSTFETTIRSLGGLLAAYDWSGDRVFLDKADDLASRLFRAFETPSGLPASQVNLGTGKPSNGKGNCVLAEAGTIQIEFRYIALATATPDYASKVNRVFDIFNQLAPNQGLYPLNIRNNAANPSFLGTKISFGAMGDSAYEYMLKTWLQGGRKEEIYRTMYDKSIQGMHDQLLHKTTPSNLVYTAEKNGAKIIHKMDHLACFLGGTLALGAYTDPKGLESFTAQRDLRTAKSLAYTCYQMYARMRTGLAPEFINIVEGSDFNAGPKGSYYILRPETVETFYYLNKLTGDPVYREWGWEIFQSLERYSKTSIAYMHIKDVNNVNKQNDDHMESFFPAETLKYLYLLFDPDSEIDILEKHVFNTEAHPVRIFKGLDSDEEFQAVAQTFTMEKHWVENNKTQEFDRILSEARDNLKKGQRKTRSGVPQPLFVKENPPTSNTATVKLPPGKYEDRFPAETKLLKEGAPVPDKVFPYLGSSVSKDHDFSAFKPLGGRRHAEYKDGGSPFLITNDIRDQSDALARQRKEFIKAAMQHSWKGYKKHAMGHDEVLPVKDHSGGLGAGIGATLVDSLDTLWLMGMKDDFWEGRDWVRDRLDYSKVEYRSTFDLTIRSLGGLLSAYDLSGDTAFLDKADDLASRLYPAFGSESGIAYGEVNLSNGQVRNVPWLRDQVIIAEAGSLQVEFRYIGVATSTLDYATSSEKVFLRLKDMAPANGLLPLYLRNKSGVSSFSTTRITFGATGDSVYEYMLKVWLQGGKVEKIYREMYDKAIQGMHDVLLQKSKPDGLVFVADLTNGNLDLKMDHLVCYLGGTLALGAYTDPQGFESFRAQRDLRTAKALAYTCYQMFARMPTGLSAEFARFSNGKDFVVPSNAPFYLLRSEALETFYYLDKLTGDPIYREWGWEVFQAIEKYCKTAVAYASYTNVESVDAGLDNKMETFFSAETLKYLYLLMDPDSEIDVLNKHVFNTEGHPLRMFDSLKGDEKFMKVAEKYLISVSETAASAVKKKR